MRRAKYPYLMLVLLLLSSMLPAFAQKRNSLLIADDRLLLEIDLKSSPAEIDSILKTAGISRAQAGIIKKGDFAAINDDGWRLASRQDDIARFERSLTDLSYNAQNRPFQITTEIPSIDGKPGYPANVKYGVNKYAKLTVYQLSTGLTRFILPGFEKAKRVFLSGSFNEWSTLKGLMKKAGGGWMLDVKLDPGAYEYKYIVDGRWMTDPNNLQETSDGSGNVNSLFYRYNYTFKLPGHALVKRVMVAGDFNNWNANELVMDKTATGWERQLYLSDGKHAYRFMTDGTWITDPANPVKETNAEKIREDKYAALNAMINIGEVVPFKLAGYPDAKNVILAGEFIGLDEKSRRLQRKGNNWVLQLVLAAGNYDYRFVVDGKVIRDPGNPSFSVKDNSEWSFLAVSPNYTFKLKGHDDAAKVTLCGVFNNWEPNGYRMAFKDGEWKIAFHLAKGKYLYKFRVNDNWIIDPGNKLWEQNQYHTGNSVLWIE